MAISPKSIENYGLPCLLTEEQQARPLVHWNRLCSALDGRTPSPLPANRLQAGQTLLQQRLQSLLAPTLDEQEWTRSAQLATAELSREQIPLEFVADGYRLFLQAVRETLPSLGLSDAVARELPQQISDRLLRDLALLAAVPRVHSSPAGAHSDLPAQLDRLLLTVSQDKDLYPHLCRFLCRVPGLDGAWLGRPDSEGTVHIHATAGDGTEKYLAGAPICLGNDTQSPLGRAWITGETQFIADYSDPQEARLRPYWQQRAQEFGWRSSCAIPVAGTLGQREVLVLYSKTVAFFSREEIRAFIAHMHATLGLALERIRLMHAMEQQQEMLSLYKAAMDASRNGILICDAVPPERPIQYANPAFEQMTGYSAEEALGQSCRFLQNGDRQQPQLDTLRQALDAGNPCEVEVRNYRKDGTLFWNRLSIAPVHSESGAVSHFIGVQSDVTGLKMLANDSARAASLYRALMSAAELVVRAQNERELLDDLCRVLVESSLFALAWIGRPNLSGELEIQSIFSSFPLQQNWFSANVYTEDEERVLSVRAWRSSKLQYSNDRMKDPEHGPVHAFYGEHGLHATAVVPLFRDGDLWALLTLVSKESDIFVRELLELLERIGRLIGHGLDSLDLRQILEQERQHQSWLARHDALTDILNRRGMLERLEEASSRARRQKKTMAVAVMDLDGFKTVNDLYGHPTGDLLLRTVAERLQAELRQSDAVGRLGSDEFVLVFEELDREEDLDTMLARVLAAVEKPVPLPNDRTAQVRGDIGVTLFPQDDSAPERLLRHAVRALYALKESREDVPQRWMRFHPQEDEERHARQRTVVSLFRSGNAVVHYQPVLNLKTGEITGVEALARLAGPNNTLLSPAEFIHQLNPADLMMLTHQVLDTAIADLHRLDKAGFPLTVGINFEPVMLADPKAIELVRRQVQNSGLEAGRIVFELLERTDILSIPGAQEALRELKSGGVRIALDDVGSAYSSLLRVKELPVDLIKLDRSFLIGLERQPRQLRFLMNMVQMLQGLGLDLVVEGIECQATGDALAALGARYAQGYHIARPMHAEELLRWLRRYRPAPWNYPTTLLGAVALQIAGLDAVAHVLPHRPNFLSFEAGRDPDTECAIGTHFCRLGPEAQRAAEAHHAWHKTMASLCRPPDGVADPVEFERARYAFEEELFSTVLEGCPSA